MSRKTFRSHEIACCSSEPSSSWLVSLASTVLDPTALATACSQLVELIAKLGLSAEDE
jgi:hypothetical protein